MEFEDTYTDPLATERVVSKKGVSLKRIVFFVTINIVNVMLLILLLVGLLTPAHTQTNTSIDNADSLGDISSPLIGKEAPNFNLPTLRGNNRMHLSDFRGKEGVILNFWASWCGPCNEEAPLLQKMWPSLQAHGIVLIGVNSGGDIASNEFAFLKKYSVTYPNLQDSFDSATAISYGVTMFPETIFINKGGMVVAKWVAPLTNKGLQLEVAKLSSSIQ